MQERCPAYRLQYRKSRKTRIIGYAEGIAGHYSYTLLRIPFFRLHLKIPLPLQGLGNFEAGVQRDSVPLAGVQGAEPLQNLPQHRELRQTPVYSGEQITKELIDLWFM